ncbi:MAG: glycoside hydrolase family 3 C-terminal domain-containing protein [Anaerolineaceae bacterium]|nr:glycoside hydrolase family 3 C-terminal domain-containing protein [Anaerolineaceae bacterium]
MKKRFSFLPILALLLMLTLLTTVFISSAQSMLAPDGTPGETYYAPFPLKIVRDGDLSDWGGVPTVTLPAGVDLSSGRPAVTFAAAADDEYLYLMADVIDDNIISGEHGLDYWNEDSVEFYINGTNDLSTRQYADGIAQVTVPPVNIGVADDGVVISGVRGDTVSAQVTVVKTATGYAVEMAVPLVNDVWRITPQHGRAIGFQVHLNSASTSNRDGKLIWSIYDGGDHSYQDPSLFGRLIFYEIGQTGRPDLLPTATFVPSPTPVPIEENAVYKNPDAPIDERVEDLLARMTLDEKIGQMTQVEVNSIENSDIIDMGIGSILSGGGGNPDINSPENWGEMVRGFERIALQTRLGIPLIYGVDAVHGHNNVVGAVIFPHNVGLGAANDPELMERIGRITALEMAATGVQWNFGPAVTVPQDIRWGRTYEGYSENTDLVSELAMAYMRGLQGENLADPTTVIATVKHFVGDGGTAWGSSTTEDYMLDQGVTEVDEATLRSIHLPPYIAAVENGARSVMISFSSWGGMKMHAQHYLITDVLKGELGFEGFVVSDWGGIDQINPNDYYTSVVTAINAGIDMNMVPYDYKNFITTLKTAVENGDVSMERIDDAVRRILRVKFELGLFENPFGDESLLPAVGSDTHRAVAREAVSKSLVLLRNENDALPITGSPGLILVGGQGANNLGMQLGGWAISWQGGLGETTIGTTILDALQSTLPESEIMYDRYGRFRGLAEGTLADVGIAVVGETPYAEGIGDSDTLELSGADINLITQMSAKVDKLIVVLISGRPIVIDPSLFELTDAWVAAWLPGTEGQGVVDGLLGYQPINGKLPYTWPRSMAQLPFDFNHLGEGKNGPLFPFGYGLETAVVRSSD